MLLKTTTLAAVLAAVQVSALPAPADGSLVVVETTTLDDGGVITIYCANPASLTSRTAAANPLDSTLVRRCGSNDVRCDGNHVPAYNTCNELLGRIQNSGNQLNNDPRSICLNRNGKNCCLSWSGDVGSGTESWLYPAARASQDRCVSEGQSALARDVQLGRGCVLQCLSDRPTGCN